MVQLDDVGVGLLDDLDRDAACCDLPNIGDCLVDLGLGAGRERLPLLQGEQASQFVAVLLQGVGVVFEVAVPLVIGESGPGSIRGLRSGDGFFELLRAGGWRLGQHLARRWVEDVEAVLRPDQLAGDAEVVWALEDGRGPFECGCLSHDWHPWLAFPTAR